MGIIAASLKRNVWVDRGFYRLYPNLYTVLVGPTAGPKKSTCAKMAAKVLLTAFPELNKTTGRQTMPDMVREMATQVREETDPGRSLPRVIADGSKFILSLEL